MKITLHWTAGVYEPNDIDRKDYHVLILKDGSVQKNHNFGDKLEHCWRDNTGNIGIAVCGMWQAHPGNFGQYAYTPNQLWGMIKAAAAICLLKNIPVENVKTHAERAIEKGYFGERWDWACMAPVLGICPAVAERAGNLLRHKIGLMINTIETGVGLKGQDFYPELVKVVKK